MSKHILIIEDEQYLADMYKLKFEHEGYRVTVAMDGEEGIAQAVSEQPDLILLDLVMPKLDGLQVLAELRKHELTRRLKIYILSNLSQNNEVQKAIEQGADGFLVKANVTPRQLAEYVKNIFSNDDDTSEPTPILKKISKESLIATKPVNGKNILLIEDQDEIVVMYKMRLEKEGFTVEIARNGAWGLKLAKEQGFSIIIMDIIMPAMNGLDMLKKLRADSKNKKVPIIVLSNSAQDKEIAEAKACGATDYLLKSKITPVKLVKEVNKLLDN
jgi:DNA-binding response OmpR family regulator